MSETSKINENGFAGTGEYVPDYLFREDETG